MNKNLLKWILIAAVILGAAGYLVLSETSSNSKKEQIVVGHSKPFKIEPIEGITISAPKNALDKNREFKLEPVKEKVYNRVVEQIQQYEDIKPFAVLELDAGLKPDDRFPGHYEVVFDLDEIGIPRELQKKVVVYRGTGPDKELVFHQYNTRLNDGKLSFTSNQNSKLVLGLRHRPDSFLYSTASLYYFRSPLAYFVEAISTWGSGTFSFDWSQLDVKWKTIHLYFTDMTYLTIFVPHESGDFRIHFRFKDTEDKDRLDQYKTNDKAFEQRIGELEKQAHSIWEAKVSKQVENELGEYKKNEFFLWMFSKKQVDAIKASISEEKIFDSLVMADRKLDSINKAPEGKLPKSIEDIIEDVIRANQYLCSIGLDPLHNTTEIFLVDETATGAEGSAQKYWLYDNGFLLLKYPNYFKDHDKMRITLVHELGHLRQQCQFGMDRVEQEATIVVLERDAARLWYEQCILSKEHNPESRTTVQNIMTTRANHQMFGYPLDETVFSDDGYTMGDAIEGIRKGVGKEKTRDMMDFIATYRQSGPHKKGWTGWIKEALDIDDAQLNQGWKYFGETHLAYLYDCLSSSAPKKTATVSIRLEPDSPVAQLKTLSNPKDYAVSTFQIDLPPKASKVGDEAANVFVYCDDETPNPYVNFYWSDYCFREYLKTGYGNTYLLQALPSLFYAGNRETDYSLKVDGTKNYNRIKNGYQLAAVTSAQSQGPKCNYYVVALFKPEAPEIRKVKDDKITFIVPKPARALTKEKLITGVVVTYKDKNGEEYTREIEPKNFGKKATWTVTGCSKKGNSFTLSLQWYYKPDEQTTYVSPIGEPAQWGAKGDQPEEEENVQTKEPETNYWKQVSSRMTMKNTSIDVDESNDDEVSSDYRSIDLQAAKTGRSLEFTGMGATEEKTKENGRVYVQDIFIEGTLTYTEPPKFWIPTQQYKAHWEIADDPYLTKVSDPFVFEAKNTSSDQAACAQSKKDKIDNGRSSVGKVNWLRGSTTTFEARHPEKDGPKSFTLTQTYSIKERQGSDLMATVTFVYNYEWVGEEEPEPEVEEETVPEGGYWKMVKSFEDTSKAAGETHPGKTVITGGRGNYKLNWQYEGTKIVPGGKASQSAMISPPQKTYLPGEKINFDYSFGDLSIEGKANTLIAGVHGNDGGLELLRGICRDYKETNYGTFGFVNSIRVKKSSGSSQSYLTAPTQKEAESFSNGHQFSIVDKASAAGGIYCTIYVYEWVDGGKTAESVKDEPSQEDQENFLDITEIQFYCHTNEPYGKGVVYTTYDHQGVSYKFKKTGSSSTFNGRDYDSEDVFTTTRSGDYQIVTAKFRQNKFDGSKANVDGYRSGGNKTCVDEEFTLTLKIAKDRSVEGTFSGTRKTLAGAGSWPEVASTCNMSISGSFGPEKIKDNDYSHDFTTINSFSYSVGGFQAYFKRADGTMPTNVDNTREFKFSTTSTNARICLSIFGTK